MTNDDKNLLLKELCARLPHNVECSFTRLHNDGGSVEITRPLRSVDYDGIDFYARCQPSGIWCTIESVKLHLRPLSSITEDEEKEFESLYPGYSISKERNSIYHSGRGDLDLNIIDFLNSHQFDYRNLLKLKPNVCKEKL